MLSWTPVLMGSAGVSASAMSAIDREGRVRPQINSRFKTHDPPSAPFAPSSHCLRRTPPRMTALTDTQPERAERARLLCYSAACICRTGTPDFYVPSRSPCGVSSPPCVESPLDTRYSCIEWFRAACGSFSLQALGTVKSSLGMAPMILECSCLERSA